MPDGKIIGCFSKIFPNRSYGGNPREIDGRITGHFPEERRTFMKNNRENLWRNSLCNLREFCGSSWVSLCFCFPGKMSLKFLFQDTQSLPSLPIKK